MSTSDTTPSTEADRDETVELPKGVVETAHRELDHLITQTGGPDPRNGAACSPLALAIQRIKALEHVDARTRREILQVIEGVADERGVEVNAVDPLTDGVFRARNELGAALEDGDA